MSRIDLSQINGGALQEKFDKAFKKVMQNLMDPNTSFKDKRGITIKFSFSQNEERDDVSVDIDVTEKLAPQTGMRTSFSTAKDLHTGEVYAEEYGRQVKGQVVLRDVQPEKAYGEIPCDPETGEVLEDKVPNVIDLRRAAAN